MKIDREMAAFSDSAMQCAKTQTTPIVHRYFDAASHALRCHCDLVEQLQKLRDEFSRLPHSLGYEYTHLPEADAILARAKGEK